VQAPLRLLLTALLCNMLTSMMPQLNEELRLLELPNAEGNREFQVCVLLLLSVVLPSTHGILCLVLCECLGWTDSISEHPRVVGLHPEVVLSLSAAAETLKRGSIFPVSTCLSQLHCSVA
jgi:hypothetical protein